MIQFLLHLKRLIIGILGMMTKFASQTQRGRDEEDVSPGHICFVFSFSFLFFSFYFYFYALD